MYAVDKETQCWNWNGSVSKNGYGVKHLGRKSKVAHRYMYELVKGEIPPGLELDHLCRNRLCVNPDHLEPVTHAENMRRSPKFLERVESKFCKYGHLLDGVRTRSGGGRYCKTCVSNNKKRQIEKRRMQSKAT